MNDDTGTMTQRKENAMNGAQHDNGSTAYGPEGYQAQQQAAARTYPAPGAQISRKSPAMATWLSLGPGLGQIYVGYYNQGFTNIAVVAAIITLLASGVARPLVPFLGVFLAFFWIFNMIDANRRAQHYNRVKAGLAAETVPDEFQLPKGGGSLTWGTILIAAGVLIFLDLNFGVSLEWIEDFWPLALVLFGARLVWKARANRS